MYGFKIKMLTYKSVNKTKTFFFSFVQGQFCLWEVNSTPKIFMFDISVLFKVNIGERGKRIGCCFQRPRNKIPRHICKTYQCNVSNIGIYKINNNHNAFSQFIQQTCFINIIPYLQSLKSEKKNASQKSWVINMLLPQRENTCSI